MIKKIKLVLRHLIKKSENYLKTDVFYLARGGFWLSIAQAVSSVSGFLLAIAFANLLPQETYGTYKYVLSLLSLLSISTLGGMNTAIIRAAARGYEGTVKLALGAKMRWGTLGALGSLGIAGYYFLGGNNSLALSFLAAAIFLPFMDSFTLFDSYLQGKKFFNVTTRYNVIIKIVSTVLMVAALFFIPNLVIVLLVYLASYTFLRLIFLNITLKKFVTNSKIDSDAIPYGFHLTIIGILANITSQLDSILMWHYLNATALAVYAMAMAPVNQIKSLLKSFVTISMPKLAEQDKETIKKTLPLKIIKSILLISGPMVVLILLMPNIYQILFPKYLASVKYAQFLVLSLIFFPERLFSIGTLVHANKTLVYATNLFNPLLKITILLLLLPTYGIAGAVAAVFIHQFLYLFVDLYFFKKM